jgi:hypothetical protein
MCYPTYIQNEHFKKYETENYHYIDLVINFSLSTISFLYDNNKIAQAE